MSHPPQLTLEIAGRSWPLQSGDIIGRFGTVATEILKDCDVISRQHLRVDVLHGSWHLTLLPNARNTTRLDGRVMAADQPVSLGILHDITIHTLHLRLLQSEFASNGEMLSDHPVALVTLDALLTLQQINPAARQLLGSSLEPGGDISRAFDAQSLVTLRLTMDSLGDGETSLPLELHTASPGTRQLRAVFKRHQQHYHGVILEVTAERSREEVQQKTERRFHAMLHDLQQLMTAESFRQGDLPAVLPALAQCAAGLLPQTAVSLWLTGKDGLFHPAAQAGLTMDKTPAATSRSTFPDPAALPVEASFPHASQHADGALLIGRDPAAPWTESQSQLAGFMDAIFAEALHNARRQAEMLHLQQREDSLKIEFGQAKRYLSRLLPAPVLQGSPQVQYHYQPCGGLGGDVFGYEWLGSDRFCLYVVDVAGHGIGAALLAVSIVNHIRLSIERKESWLLDPAAWLQQLNQTFQMEKHSDLTWTLWCGIYHAPKRELHFASGGHPPAILMDRERVRELTTQGPVMGALQDVVFQSAKVKLHPGAKVLLYTDGVYEFPLADGSTGSYDDFLHTVSSTLHMTEGECSYLHQHAAALCSSRDFPDDFTMICVKFA